MIVSKDLIFIHLFLFKYFCFEPNHIRQRLSKYYGKRTVTNKVSFQVGQGEIVGLLGPNGAGKTTSFYQVVGLVKPDEGDVFLNDINITNYPCIKGRKWDLDICPRKQAFSGNLQ